MQAIEGRIKALARAHTLLSDSRWRGADLGTLVGEELAPYRTGDKVHCGGMIVRGKVKGTVESHGPVLIGPEAEVKGDVTAPTLSINDVRANSSGVATTFTFTVTLSSPISQPVTVAYATADGTAMAPVDYLSTSDRDGAVCVWDRITKLKSATFDHGVYALAFDPQGRFLAGAGIDDLVYIWDVSSQREVFRLDGHGERINAVAFTQFRQARTQGLALA